MKLPLILRFICRHDWWSLRRDAIILWHCQKCGATRKQEK